jgi:hypothetical protein
MYSTWALDDLRAEADTRNLRYSSKDGVKTLSSKLRRHDRHSTGESNESEDESKGEEKIEYEVGGKKLNAVSFEEQMIVLEMQRKIRQEEMEGERELIKLRLESEERIAEEKREEKKKKREWEERIARENRESEERVAQLKLEAERVRQETEKQLERDRRELDRERRESVRDDEGRNSRMFQFPQVQEKPKYIKIREMRVNEDIDDYFKIFEMTAKAQFLPEKEWIGNIIPKLAEKAKTAYLEIPDRISQDYYASKAVIIKAYQLTADHYRYRFRNSEKRPDEDFVQWGHRTRRYLIRWMTVAEAAGDGEKILEEIMIERLLDAVGPELRAWLKEQKPKTAEELGNLANLHVQSRKGPMVAGKYVSYRYARPEERKKQETKPEENNTKTGTMPKPQYNSNPNLGQSTPGGRSTRPSVKCFKCGKEGHMSFNCYRGRGKPSQGYLLCITPLTANAYPESPDCYVKGKIEGRPVTMVIDSGCSKTLVHERFLNRKKLTGDKIAVLTATGERITVPLAQLVFESEQGTYEEIVGVTDKLPVDCLLGRSSFGKTLSKQNILDQWEKSAGAYSGGTIKSTSDEALAVTRSKTAEIAQQRANELIDRENDLLLKSLAKPETRVKDIAEGDLSMLFDEGKTKNVCQRDREEKTISKQDIPVNILDRTRNQLIEDQQSDVTLGKVRKEVSEGLPENKDGYIFDKGLILHRKIVSDVPDGIRNVDRIVVPEAYRNEVLRVAHTIPLAGHMGVKKTSDRITAHFFWPGLKSDVKQYCGTCPECQMVARKLTSSRAPLNPTEIISEPFKKIAIDMVGELPKSSSGFKYILTIIDYATRYPEAIPLKSTNSRVVADALLEFFARVGIPEELVSDQGSNFIGNVMTQLYENLGIHKIKTSVYHPEGNGLVERFHSTLKSMLKKFVGECVKTWDKYLPYLLFAYREVPTESTGYSPFELLYGRTIRGPLAVIKETWLEKRPDTSNLTSYVLEMRKRLATMQEVVKKNLNKAQGKQKRSYDIRSLNRKFEVGDRVLLLLPTPGSKIEIKWQGPYTVTKVMDNGLNYELDTGKAVKQHRVYHINLLRKWQSRDEIAALVVPESSNAPLPHEANVPPTYNKEDWRDVEISDKLDENQKQELKEVLEEYSDVLSGVPNLTNAAVHEIDTGDSPPIRCTPYRIPQKLEEEVNKEIEKMLTQGIIRPSTSPWAAPVVIIPKPDGTIRLCVDYRKLNEVTKMDAYPIPSMDRMIEKVTKAKYISTLDLTKGYWQIPLADSTIEKSTMITGKGIFDFLVMPFGMKTAPATFQRMMSDVVLNDFDFADAYIDDVEIDTESSFALHLEQLKQVLQRLRECKLNARPSKCKIAMGSVEFVGHRVGTDKIEPKAALVQAIETFPRPQTKRQVKSFIGLAGYYRKFVPQFSERAAVLTDLTKGRSPTKLVWNEQHEMAFEDLKNALKTPPVLRPPHWDKTFILQVDASNRGLGAILSQTDENGDERPIAYASRKLQPREEKLSTTEKECLSIVWGVETFRYYLYGRRFILQTDHNPLVWLKQVRDKNRKLLRWSISLQEYDIQIEHKPGKRHVNVDALSRV